ncbi:MAG: hypothetical protein ACN6Q5_10100 [Pseudomonas sp.]|uniref:hypothetical protein n=1 Tax=Pseudomonas sp. TaxID=306 RepID=UPI003D14700D
MKPSILTLVTLYCLGTCSAFADGPQVTNDKRGPAGIAVAEPWVAARTKLIEHGWKPTRMHGTDGYEYSGVEPALSIVRAASCSTQEKALAYESIPSASNSMT